MHVPHCPAPRPLAPFAADYLGKLVGLGNTQTQTPTNTPVPPQCGPDPVPANGTVLPPFIAAFPNHCTPRRRPLEVVVSALPAFASDMELFTMSNQPAPAGAGGLDAVVLPKSGLIDAIPAGSNYAASPLRPIVTQYQANFALFNTEFANAFLQARGGYCCCRRWPCCTLGGVAPLRRHHACSPSAPPRPLIRPPAFPPRARR